MEGPNHQKECCNWVMVCVKKRDIVLMKCDKFWKIVIIG